MPNPPTSNSTVRASTATTLSPATPLQSLHTTTAQPATRESVNNEPSDPTVTEAPPPAYELCDNFATCTKTSDFPPDYPDPPSYDV